MTELNNLKLDKLCKRLRNSSFSSELLAADAIESLRKRIEELEYALKELLEDSQHTTHQCDDADCPVSLARNVLKK